MADCLFFIAAETGDFQTAGTTAPGSPGDPGTLSAGRRRYIHEPPDLRVPHLSPEFFPVFRRQLPVLDIAEACFAVDRKSRLLANPAEIKAWNLS